MPENLTTLTVEQFKLVCIDDEKFTDAAIKILFVRVVIESENDLEEIVLILQKYRPSLIDELFGFDKIQPKNITNT